MEKKRVYISGPISGHDYDERKKTFYETQKRLEANGFEVFNPMQNGLPKDATSQEHMRVDFRMVTDCDAIAMLPKWNHSAGCMQEFMVAVSSGLSIMFIKSLMPLEFTEIKFD